MKPKLQLDGSLFSVPILTMFNERTLLIKPRRSGWNAELMFFIRQQIVNSISGLIKYSRNIIVRSSGYRETAIKDAGKLCFLGIINSKGKECLKQGRGKTDKDRWGLGSLPFSYLEPSWIPHSPQTSFW